MATTTYTILDGEVLSQSVGGVTHDYLPDPQGNTVALLDSNQNITDTFTYWPYGEERVRTGTTSCPFRYDGAHGYYHDPSTNKLYVRARYLDAAKGRWLTADPLGSASGDRNMFRYVANSPMTNVDPTGLLCNCTKCSGCKERPNSGTNGSAYGNCIQQAIARWCGNQPGVNSKLIRCMIFAESNGNADVQNPNSGASGIMQITSDTWGAYCGKDYGSFASNWRDPCKNISCGVKILCRAKHGKVCGKHSYGTDCSPEHKLCCCLRC